MTNSSAAASKTPDQHLPATLPYPDTRSSILGAATGLLVGTAGILREPIDLKSRFGDRFRVFASEDHEPGMHRDPWNYELRGPGGAKVWPYSATHLCAYVSGAIRRNRLLRLGEPFQVGDHECVIRFEPDGLELVAGYLKLYRRRTLTGARRERAIARLARMRAALPPAAPRRAR